MKAKVAILIWFGRLNTRIITGDKGRDFLMIKGKYSGKI